MKKIIIAGGTGFIGQYLSAKFRNMGCEVQLISRQPEHITWDDHDQLVKALEDSDILINLSGKSVNCRYHSKNKKIILNSRIETTSRLGKAVSECKNPPKVWINSSTATIYRHAEDRPMTEINGDMGTGFSVEVAQAWEHCFFSFNLPDTRQIALRIAIVLGKDNGVLPVYQNLVKFGLGGHQGNGRQKFSWIHIEDLYQIILFIYERPHLSGVFNCSSPQPVDNKAYMKSLRDRMNKTVGLPAPKFLLEIGSFFIRTETELVLKSRWVLPDRLEKEGYIFIYPSLDKALNDLI